MTIQMIGSHTSGGKHYAKHDATKRPCSKILKQTPAALAMRGSKMRIHEKRVRRVNIQRDLTMVLAGFFARARFAKIELT